jgi:hypothetical protein
MASKGALKLLCHLLAVAFPAAPYQLLSRKEVHCPVDNKEWNESIVQLFLFEALQAIFGPLL